jgi:hypothetical protein
MLCKIGVMCKLTKSVLAWLLLLVIPVQGFSATVMFFCAPSHHNTMARIVKKDHAQLPAPTSHQHGKQGLAKNISQSEDLSVNHAATAKIGNAGDGKCSACASCCIGSVIIRIQSFSHTAMTGSERIPFVQESFVNHTPERLDPPPKSFPA